MSKENDRALRFYHEVLGLDHLHYGIWLPEDELTTDMLKVSQQRYEDYLVENLPPEADRILDVGCGTSVMSRRLIQRGLKVEGLSPDAHQKEVFTDQLEAPFHACRFEDFDSPDGYDCLIMSESAQYIRLRKLFTTAARCLQQGGYLMVCDYFVLDHATGVIARSGHNLNEFREEAASNGFAVVREEDLTDVVIKTLDLASHYVDKLELAIEIGTESIRTKHRHLSRMALWLFRGKIARLQEKRQLINAETFAENKRYMFFLYQLN